MKITSFIKRLIQWCKRIFLWAIEPIHFWLTLSVPTIVLAALYWHGITEPAVRITGLYLQIFGIGTVFWGIRETRKLFNHPSIIKSIVNWWHRRPTFRKRVVSATGKVSARATANARGHASYGVNPNDSIESQIKTLEKSIKLINTRINQIEKETKRNIRTQFELIKQEENNRSSADKMIEEKLKIAETGGINISIMGLFWLIAGVTLSTASPEIFSFFK